MNEIKVSKSFGLSIISSGLDQKEYLKGAITYAYTDNEESVVPLIEVSISASLWSDSLDEDATDFLLDEVKSTIENPKIFNQVFYDDEEVLTFYSNVDEYNNWTVDFTPRVKTRLKKIDFRKDGLFMDNLIPIIMTYRGESEEEQSEPLDGDSAEKLGNMLRVKIDFHEGNITEEEYDERLDLPVVEQKLIDKTLENIKEDILKGDLTAIEELIKSCPKESLVNFSPEE